MAIVNHPVHILAKYNQTSPSALIPFCDFGGNMSSMGVKVDHFDVPLCNSFQAKIQNDQLCYEVDLNKFSNKANIERELELGFNFLLDYNEDRQVVLDAESSVNVSTLHDSLARSIEKSKKDQQAFIYLDTIGKLQLIMTKSAGYCVIS